jgi:hypothetical protein
MTPIVEEFKEQILVQIGVLDSTQVDQKLNDKIVEIDSMESRIQ